MNIADRRNNNDRLIFFLSPQDRQPEIKMRIIAASDEFGRAQRKNWPRPDCVTDIVAIGDYHAGNLCIAGDIQPAIICNPVPDNQNSVHPPRTVAKDGKEIIDNAALLIANARFVRIAKPSILNAVPVTCTNRRNIAYAYQAAGHHPT